MKIDRDVLDEVNREWNRMTEICEEIYAGLYRITLEMANDEEFLGCSVGEPVYESLMQAKDQVTVMVERTEKLKSILLEIPQNYDHLINQHKNKIEQLGESLYLVNDQYRSVLKENSKRTELSSEKLNEEMYLEQILKKGEVQMSPTNLAGIDRILKESWRYKEVKDAMEE